VLSVLNVAAYVPGAIVEEAEAVAELTLDELAAALALETAADVALALAEDEPAALDNDPDAHPAIAMRATSIMTATAIPIFLFTSNAPLSPAHERNGMLLARTTGNGIDGVEAPPARVMRSARRGSQRFSPFTAAWVPWLGGMRLTVMALARDSHPVSPARPPKRAVTAQLIHISFPDYSCKQKRHFSNRAESIRFRRNTVRGKIVHFD